MKLEGIVQKTSTKDSPAGAVRKWKQKSFCINDVWFNVFVNPENRADLDAITEGTNVMVEYSPDGKYTKVDYFKILSQPTVAAAKASGVEQVVPPVSDKDIRITYLASRKDALNFLELALPLDILTLPVKKADKADALYEYLVHYTNQFLSDAYAAKLVPTKENNNNNDSDSSTASE